MCHQKVKENYLLDKDKVCYLIGCPTAWPNDAVEEYRRVFVEAGLPHPLVVRESWAALIHARDSRRLDSENKNFDENLDVPIVVIDIGSSTTDITYINKLQVKDVESGYDLGAGLIDEYILEENLKKRMNPSDRQWWGEHFARDPKDRRRALFVARKLKEEYFKVSKARRKKNLPESKTKYLVKKLELETSQEMIDDAVHRYRYEQLAGKTWADAYRELLQKIRSRLDSPPAFILLTGGASRMEFPGEICKEIFGEGTFGKKDSIKHESSPETMVASGLARTGRWLQRCRTFAEEIENTFTVEALKEKLEPEVPKAIEAFLLKSLDSTFKGIMPACIDEWKEGKIKAADGLAKAFIEKGREWEASGEGREIKNEAAQQLIKVVLHHVEADAEKIASQYSIPSRKLHFELDVGNVPHLVEIQEWLENEYYVGFDKAVGELIDWFKGWADWAAPLVKGALWLVGQFEVLIVPAVGGLLSDAEAEQHTQRLAEELHTQMLKQFRDQQKSVLPWIR
ncbi:Hsp70 family protein [Nitrosococcus watsonii]|uniref:Hsp70 family protein n=1 Tax=Nitrosococcus watsonii TaxID=473531 RepID=UPI0012FC7AB0|nr:hypothetical protein [Nitrosococcus watsonii]